MAGARAPWETLGIPVCLARKCEPNLLAQLVLYKPYVRLAQWLALGRPGNPLNFPVSCGEIRQNPFAQLVLYKPYVRLAQWLALGRPWKPFEFLLFLAENASRNHLPSWCFTTPMFVWRNGWRSGAIGNPMSLIVSCGEMRAERTCPAGALQTLCSFGAMASARAP